MSPGASVGAHDPLRLFCALRLPEAVLDPLVAWQGRELAGGRLVARAQLHVTLAFLGSRPAGELPAIAAELGRAATAASRPVLQVTAYRETRSVGMLVFADVGERAAALAADLHARLERLGVYEPERRPWLPHVTVLRFRTRPRLRPRLPELGDVSPSDAAVYSSVLRPSGAQYEVLESVPLGG
ncbi:MAG: RNA 2',3'-cyclic phosphodiesterase [Thermoleophilia bacterium]|nr:RNA 2',3'-cyclic phosphodiesterase [Thermoleophilia bacterium]